MGMGIANLLPSSVAFPIVHNGDEAEPRPAVLLFANPLEQYTILVVVVILLIFSSPSLLILTLPLIHFTATSDHIVW